MSVRNVISIGDKFLVHKRVKENKEECTPPLLLERKLRHLSVPAVGITARSAWSARLATTSLWPLQLPLHV